MRGISKFLLTDQKIKSARLGVPGLRRSHVVMVMLPRLIVLLLIMCYLVRLLSLMLGVVIIMWDISTMASINNQHGWLCTHTNLSTVCTVHKETVEGLPGMYVSQAKIHDQVQGGISWQSRTSGLFASYLSAFQWRHDHKQCMFLSTTWNYCVTITTYRP